MVAIDEEVLQYKQCIRKFDKMNPRRVKCSVTFCTL